jgi:cytochrome c553
MPVRYHFVAAAILATAAASTAADKIPDDQLKFFEAKIRPVLIAQCYSCHSADTKKGPKAGLALDTADGLKKGGDSGPAVVAGNVKKSLLIKALKGIDDQARMPPKEKLPADVIADFEKWVAMGAPDPRTGGGKVDTKVAADPNKGKDHWAFQPVKAVEPPKAGAWATTPVDQFVWAGLQEHKLTPVADADKRTLLRRVYFDLTGLPPTPSELDVFLKDNSPNAFEQVVDRLLASPQFGEKWGRHWLDVARYAESSGKEQNVFYPHAWRYRDYVIAAFNADIPIDRFFKEQLAGDLMSGKDDTDKANKIIATGYLAVGPKSHNERNRRQFELDVADEQIDAFSQGMLGLTVACARCHDHKLTPSPLRTTTPSPASSPARRRGSAPRRSWAGGTAARPSPCRAGRTCRPARR